jgi:hypothetical protein
VFVALAVGWFMMVQLLSNDLAALDSHLDIWMRLLQLLLIVAIIGTLAAIWNAFRVATAPGRHVVATLWAILIALAAAFMVWLCLDLGLLTASLNY